MEHVSVLAKKGSNFVGNIVTRVENASILLLSNTLWILQNVTHSKPESVRDVWIMIDDISLTVVDKTILTSNEWLTDSHIRAVQYLLQQHPGISGFQSPT